MTSRRFPAPWQIEQTPGGYKVLDANGQALAYVYARETRQQADIAQVLTFDEARRDAVMGRLALIGGKRGAVRTLTLKAFSEDEYHKIVRSLD